METHNLDFHITFRKLASFRASIVNDQTAMDAFVSTLSSSKDQTQDQATAEWKSWLGTFAERVQKEKPEWPDDDFEAQRVMAARGANPRFVLRQWVLEEVIKRVEDESKSGRRILAKVLHVSTHGLTSSPSHRLTCL